MPRRRSNRVKNANHSDRISTVHEFHEDRLEYLKHRTCWKHLLAHMLTKKKKMYNEEFKMMQANAPCFFKMFPHGKRSPRRIKCKFLVSKLTKKLDSQTFMGYLESMWTAYTDDKKNSCLYLDCVWFSLYKFPHLKPKVLKWIKAKKIFVKKYVFVPIVCWDHWNLLIFCNFGESLESGTRRPCMLLLDSLHMAGPRRLEPDIRKFVLDIYKTEGRTDNTNLIRRIPLLVPEVPQQQNDVECGSYVLFFINKFMEDAPQDFSIEGYPYFMVKDWFSPEGIEDFRSRLDSIVGAR